MSTDRPCPSRQTVTALLFGTLPPEQEDEVNLHLEDCPACAAQARQIESEADPLLDALRQPAPPPAETPAPAPMSDQPEAFQLDGFRILNELGRGGMGVVYRAYQHRLNRLVAIKMILSGQLAGADERARFMMEGSLLAQLNHPNFVQVYEVGTVALSAGTLQPYLVLEFVDGGNLKTRLAEKLLPFAEAARLVLVLARAMEVAHAQGIVHRDLKPANVLLARDGTLKISDFGLARELKASNSLTPTGLAVGTPAYMAPEQARGHANLGPATDVYALGAILYEVLTGKVPFDGNTPVEVLVQVMQQPPAPLSGQRAGLPRDLETICLKCLQKEPQARYRSAGELADDLQAWLEHRPIQARPVGHLERTVKWARRHPLPASLLVFLILSLLLGSAGSTYLGYTASEQAVATKKALAKEEDARRASDRRAAELQLVAGRRLATDGEVERGMFTLARGWEMTPAPEADLQRVFQRDLEAWASYLPRVRWYADAADSTYVVMAGDEVVYATKDEVIARDAVTGRMLGAPRKYAGKIVALSADGSRLCTQGFENDVSILRVFERGTGKQIGVDIADKRGGDLWNQNRRNYYWMRFSPDGKLVLREFISLTLEERRVWEIASGAPIGPALTGTNARLLQSDTGAPYWLLVSDERIEVIDGRTGTVLGGADALPAEVSRPPQLFPHAQVLQTLLGGKVKWWDCSGKKGPQPDWRLPGTSSGHAVSGDGRFLVSIFGSQRLCWQDLASRRFCIPTAAMDPGTLGECISPDARNCLYVRRSLHMKFVDFPRLMPAHVPGGGVDDKRFRALAPPEVRFSGAIFSADRKTALAFGAAHAHRSSYARLTSTIDNAPLGRPMTECDTHAVISPSGRLIALATWDDTRADASPLMVRVYDAQTGEPRSRAWTVTSFMHTLAFSPDETHLAVGHVAGALLCNLVTGADSINLVQPGPISRVLFSPDSRRLALCSRSGWGSKAGTRVWDVEKAQPAGAFVPMQIAPLLVAEPGDAFRTIDLDTGRMRRWSFATAAPDADLPSLADFPTVPRGNEVWTLRSDKQWLALGSRHGAIWQWDLATGQRLGPIAEFHQPCRSLEYAPDGSWLAASGEEGDVGLFDPLTGKQAGPLLAQGEPSVGMAFTPDGSELVTVSQDGRCIRWPMGKPQPMTAAQWKLWLEAATGVRLDAETVLPLSVEEHQKRLESARALSLPLTLPGLSTSSWHAEQASSAEHAGQLNSARWHLDRWIAAAPQSWLPHARRARIHAFQGLTKEAHADLKRAAALSHDGELENWRRHQIAVAGVTGKSIPLIEALLP